MASSKRENFGSSFTFIMAMAGSAIGLGNIWRFPFMVGQYGGGAFIVAYLLCSAVIAIPCFVCESVIGRRARSGVVGAFEKLAPGTLWKRMGDICVIACFIIISFYCVVGGWSLDFFVRSITGHLAQGRPDVAPLIFSNMASSTLESVVMLVTFFLATAVIVLAGVKKGIERFTKISTPLLFVLMLLIVIYSVSLPEAGEGIRYMLHTDFGKLGVNGWAAALGQAFFSMSLGVGTVLIYSSFMKKEDNIVAAGFWTAIFDAGFALVSGFAIIPAVFSAGLEPTAGPSLVYETLPYIFAAIGVNTPILSEIVTVLFFLTILIAALTSSISIFDVCVEHAVEQYGLRRRYSVLLFLVPGVLLGVPCAMSFGSLSDFKIFGLNVFDLCDFLASNVLMMIGALCFVIFVGWVMKKDEVFDELKSGGKVRMSRAFNNTLYFVIRWFAPVAIILIFVSNFIF